MNKTKVKALIVNLMSEVAKEADSTKVIYNTKMRKLSTEEVESYYSGQLSSLYRLLTKLEESK